jgi:hypothetical protein
VTFVDGGEADQIIEEAGVLVPREERPRVLAIVAKLFNEHRRSRAAVVVSSPAKVREQVAALKRLRDACLNAEGVLSLPDRFVVGQMRRQLVDLLRVVKRPAGRPSVKKRRAEKTLQEAGLSREDARAIVAAFDGVATVPVPKS